MTPYPITLTKAGYSYGRHQALTDITTHIEAGTITGLLGRNGSGKSTLAMILAGQLKPTGTVKVDGKAPFDDPTIMPSVCLVADETSVLGDSRAESTLDLWRATRPNWNEELAARLIDTWHIDTKRAPNKYSRGQRSAFYAALGLASRCPLTIFDEVHLGMDAVVRRQFYDTLLADYVEHPRTIILSSHLISEVEHILENVLFIHHGRLLAHGEADELRETYSTDKRADLTDVLITLTEES